MGKPRDVVSDAAPPFLLVLFVETLDGVPKNRRARHEVFELHGFVRVVGAVLVGNENHGDGNAGIGENGRVVTRTRSQTHRGNARVAGAFDEAIGKRGVDDGGRRTQGVVEFETNAALGFDALRFFKKELMEVFEHLGREAAHVDREGGFARNDGNRGGRRGRQHARREDEVFAGFVPFGPAVFHA